MIGELGHLALILAWIAALVQAAAGLSARAPARLAGAALQLQTFMLVAAFGTLAWSFLQNDFTLVYVVQHSNRDLPAIYRFAAVWGGHEGSMLLWVLTLAGWSLTAAIGLGRHDAELARRTIGVLGIISIGMLAFVLFTSNPFIRLLPAAQDGQNLNPLLQDPGLVMHPPLLYLGYVGTAVPFAVVMARLFCDHVGLERGEWLRWLRPYVLWAFVTLTFGIALGSWWAYYELGWGGWWFWDPVENASFMPWLALAALLHLLAVREQRGAYAGWIGPLAVAVFALSLIGTFLVRSGVLTSVHAFATDPSRGSAMLALVAITLLASVGLLSARGQRLLPARDPAAAGLLSREGLIGINAVLLLAACATVLLGTLYPLAMDALALGKISVGAPYFDAVMLPLLLPLLPAAALGQALGWGRFDGCRLRSALLSPLVVTAIAAVWLPWALRRQYGEIHWLALLGLLLATFLAAAVLRQLWRNWRQGASAWGMALAHLGLAVFAVGVAMVNSYGVERDVRFEPGQSIALADCRLTFQGIQPERGANYASLRGHFELACPGSAPRSLHSEKRSYPGSGMPMTESAIDWGLTRDLYVALGEMGPAGPFGDWMVRVQHKPFMRWVWGGTLLMALGALVASLARRLRRRSPR